MILGAVCGRLADLWGYQLTAGLGSALMVGSMFAASYSTGYWQIFLSQGVLFGLGISLVYYPAVTISRQYFDHGRHGFANGIVVSGGALGGCVLPYCVRLSLENLGLSQTYRILGYLAAGITPISVYFLRPIRKPYQRNTPARGAMFNLSLLRNTRFLIIVISGTIAMTGFLPRYFLLSSSAIYTGVSPTYAAWLLGIMNGLSIVGRIGIGLFADHYGTLTALITSFVLCGIGHIVFWLPSVTSHASSASSTALLSLFVIYIGLLGSGFVSLLPVVVAQLFGGSHLAGKVGLLNSLMGLSVLAGPSAIYAIVSHDNNWALGILVSGLVMIIGGMAMLGAHDRVLRPPIVIEYPPSD